MPKAWVQNSGSFVRPLRPQGMPFRKLWYKKKYSYKTPLRIHTQHRCLGEHRRHISLVGKWFIRRPALVSRSTLSWAGRPLTCWGRPQGKRGFGWACLATLDTVTVVSLFGTFDILDLISKSRSFSRTRIVISPKNILSKGVRSQLGALRPTLS